MDLINKQRMKRIYVQKMLNKTNTNKTTPPHKKCETKKAMLTTGT
jgi:hypothetical protein